MISGDSEIEKNELLTYLLNYLTQHNNNNNNNNNNRYNLTTRINKTIYQDFTETCRKLGLTHHRGNSNLALEGFMAWMVQKYRDTPKIMQTTLINIHTKKVVVNPEPKPKPKRKPRPDYATLPLEQLETRYSHADSSERQLLAYEFRRRGIRRTKT